MKNSLVDVVNSFGDKEVGALFKQRMIALFFFF